MTRVARCCCGGLRVETEGEPAAVVACHCIECQRRTGSVLGVGAYFPRASVRVSGPSRSFTRLGDSGGKFVTRFCPECGTSVVWETGCHPDLVGVAVGAFADPQFPAPARSVWEQSKHQWLAFSHPLEHHPRGRG